MYVCMAYVYVYIQIYLPLLLAAAGWERHGKAKAREEGKDVGVDTEAPSCLGCLRYLWECGARWQYVSLVCFVVHVWGCVRVCDETHSINQPWRPSIHHMGSSCVM